MQFSIDCESPDRVVSWLQGQCFSGQVQLLFQPFIHPIAQDVQGQVHFFLHTDDSWN